MKIPNKVYRIFKGNKNIDALTFKGRQYTRRDYCIKAKHMLNNANTLLVDRTDLTHLQWVCWELEYEKRIRAFDKCILNSKG